MDEKLDSSDSSPRNNNADNTDDSLREFIANACKEQAQRLQEGGEVAGIDAERMNQFYQRAISESERMTNEVTKCHQQRQKLHNELGTEMFESWSEDHASEVLTDEQYCLWKNEERQSKALSEKLRDASMEGEDSGSDDASL